MKSKTLFALPALVTATAIRAAEIENLSSGWGFSYEEVLQGDCSARIRGRIEAGDAEELKAAVGPFPVDSGGEFYRVLCFSNSAGGSFSEGAALAQAITDLGMITRVEEGAFCESACALAFLGGVAPVGFHGFTPARLLSPGAKLGFHSPDLPRDIDVPTVDPGLLSSVHESALLAVVAIMTMEEQRWQGRLPLLGRPMNLEIVDAILSTPPNSIRYVSSLDDVMRFNLLVLDELSGVVAEEHMLRLCANMTYWAGREDHLAFMSLYWLVAPENGGSAVEVPQLPHGTEIRSYDVRSVEHVGEGGGSWLSGLGVVTEIPFGDELEHVTCEVRHNGFGGDLEGWMGQVHLRDPELGIAYYLGQARYVHTLPSETPLSDLFSLR